MKLVAATVAALGLMLGGCSRSTQTAETAPPPPTETQAPESQPGAAALAPPAATSTPGSSIAPRPPAAAPRSTTPRSSVAPAPAPKAPPEPKIVVVTVPAGTAIAVRTVESLSTKTATPGQRFEATLAEDLREDGRLIAQRGARAEGRVVESEKGGRVKGTASLTLQLTSLQLANGSTTELTTGTVAREAAKSTKKDALKVGIASGVGAAIGAIAGGGKGAAIGAGAGAAGGTGVVLGTRGDAASIPSESVLTFTLQTPITVKNP